MVTWKSKLGTEYPKHDIEAQQAAIMKQLTKLRQTPPNNVCFDCGRVGTVWSSVNLGVFTCLKCGGFHRALGTHISIPKGCTGTYLWGPDELCQMQHGGNAGTSKHLYREADAHRPGDNASDAEWLEFFRNKYERKRWCNSGSPESVVPVSFSSQTETSLAKAPAVNMHKFTPPPSIASTPTIDLLGSDWKTTSFEPAVDASLASSAKNQDTDFFAQFGL